MEQLKYIIEEKTLIQLLGQQNFTNKESAILELIKNAYDAAATEVIIKFSETSLIIKDNGRGMNYADIKSKWMHVGKSDKGYIFVDDSKKERVAAGAKGIGRFALSKLAEEVVLCSKKKDEKCVCWKTDWNISQIEENNALEEQGTTFILTKLRDKWTEKGINELKLFLSRTYNDTSMKIFIETNELFEIRKYFQQPKLGHNCVSYFDLSYHSRTMELECKIFSDEFSDDAKKYASSINLKKHSETINIFNYLIKKTSLFDLEDDEQLKSALIGLGDFNAQMYFSLKGVSEEDKDKFLYKYKKVPEKYDDGIILYRNAFSIISYEGKKDWIELNKRARLSPAMPSHPTGSWRVRGNHIAGKVMIDKQMNKVLDDLANRQGLNENYYYKLFVYILQEGVAIFERYRQSIIRKINTKNKTSAKSNNNKLVEAFISQPQTIKTFTNEEILKLADEVSTLKIENENVKDTEERYIYDVRILNILSTLGLKASSIAHSMHNDRNYVTSCCDSIVAAMKKQNIWDIANHEKNRRYVHEDIPRLLEKNKEINKKIISFMDSMLEDIEKEQFFPSQLNINEILERIKFDWVSDYNWIDISINIDKNIDYFTANDIIKVIFDNLILNSVQQNTKANKLKIEISAFVEDEFLICEYQDDGKGLDIKYKDNPKLIIEPHETTRTKGHGLGMWILNNTLLMTNGMISEINGDNGFYIKFAIGEMNNGKHKDSLY